MSIPTIIQQLLRSRPDHVAVQAFRFVVVGGVAFTVDFSLLLLAVHVWNWHCLAAAAMGYTVGLVVNYCLCAGWVFSQRRFQDRRPEFLLFTVIGLTGLGVTELVIWSGHSLLGVDLRLTKVAALLIVAVWNFTFRKTLVFSRPAGADDSGGGGCRQVS
jgi:putative flippase GtrA